MPTGSGPEQRRWARGGARAGVAAACCVLAACGSGPPPAARLSRSFPAAWDAPPSLTWDAAGRRVLWHSDVRSLGRLRAEGARLERDGAGARLALAPHRPLSVTVPVAAALAARDATEVRVEVEFDASQPRSPLARAEAGFGSGEWGRRGAWMPGAPAGTAWSFELPLSGDAPDARLSGVRLELTGVAGRAATVRLVELLGSGAARGPVSVTEQGATRRAVAVGGGETIALHAAAPAARARLSGEVEPHPAASGLGQPVRVLLVARAAGRELARFEQSLDPRERRWLRYDLPLEGLTAGAAVSISLSVPGPRDSGALWSEPLLLPPGDAPRRRAVLVSIDSLRADALLETSERPPLLPRLAARARREGQQVANHYAASNWTLPSHASLLLGRPASAHGATDPESVLDTSSGAALAQVLSRAGFFTAGVVDGLYVGADYGFAAGFDVYRESPAAPRRLAWHDEAYRDLRDRLRESDSLLFVHSYFVHDYYDPDTSGEPPVELPPELAAYARAEHGRLLDLAAERDDATPADPRLAPLLRALYAGRAARFDAWLDGFLDGLARDFADAPPLVVITSDHGECLGEGAGGLYWHHGGSLREDELRVPLVILHPDRRPRPALTELTSQLDLAPTLLGRLGVTPPARAYAGVDLFDAAALRQRPEVYAEDYFPGQNRWAAVARGAKLTVNTQLGPRLPRQDAALLLLGRPGGFDDGPALPPVSPDAQRMLRRRRDALYAEVDGLFLELDNPTSATRRVVLRFLDQAPAAGLAPWLGPLGLPFQAHFLEADDRVEFAPGGALRSIAFTLPPGDTDLLVSKTATRLAVQAAPEAAPGYVSLSGVSAAPVDALRVERSDLVPREGPPPVPAGLSGAVLSVWENAPPGAPRYHPRHRALSPATYERLRALGYLN